MNTSYEIFKQFIKDEKLIKPEAKILIALSGGSDSVCLFHMLRRLSREMKLELYAFHLNHMIREEAKRDEIFVENLCRKYNITLFAHTIDIPLVASARKVGLEEAGRIKRYKIINEKMKEHNLDLAATAHHMLDNSESVIFNLARGTGLDGVSGIAVKKDYLIRPLLCLTKAEILTFLRENNYEYVSDKTNLDTRYARNRIRHNVLPELEKLTTGANKHILQFSEIARDAAGLVADIARKVEINISYTSQKNQPAEFTFYNKGDNIEAVSIMLDDIKNKRDIIKSQVLFNMISLFGYSKDISFRHISSVLDLISENNTVFDINIPYQLTFKRRYDKLYLVKNEKISTQKNNDFIYTINKEGSFEFIKQGFKITTNIINIASLEKLKEKNDVKYLDADRINDTLSVRFRKDGDIFFPLGAGGSKKLKDYFIDKKIIREQRDEIPLLLDGDEIIMVIDHEINNNYKVTDKTLNILTVKYEKIL